MLPKSAVLVTLSVLVAVAGCGPSSPGSSRSAAPIGVLTPGAPTGQIKTIRIVLAQDLRGIGLGETGGQTFFNEIHSNGLVTSDRDAWRPIPQIAERVPSLDNGLIELLPDGRMKTTYPLRKDVTWQDGTPFTAKDMEFSYELNNDRSLPTLSRQFVTLMDSVETPDDYTLSIFWKSPYYLADGMGVTGFWPWPRHILEAPYRSLDKERFSYLPYWTSDYINTGPFRVAEFAPGERVVYTAYEKYFRGRPKVDRIIVTQVQDFNTVFARVKAGEVDILSDIGLSNDIGIQLQQDWAASGEGEVHFAHGGVTRLRYQLNPQVQTAPDLLDKRVRQAVYLALDRKGMALRQGSAEFVSNEFVAPGHPLYDAVKGTFDHLAFNPQRARQALADLGYRPGGDGVLIAPGGHRLEFPIWGGEQTEKVNAIAQNNLKDVGIDASVNVISRALNRDLEFRASRPGVEAHVRAVADGFLTEVESAQIPTAQNRYVGENRGAYSNRVVDELVLNYRLNMRQSERDAQLRRIHEVLADDLPMAPLIQWPLTPAVRKGVSALEDWRGAQYGSSLPFGTFTRNSHEWSLAPS